MSTDIAIRQASLQDLPVLEAMEQECFRPCQRSSRRALRLSLSSPFQQVWVAERSTGGEGPQTVGHIVIHLHRKTLRIYSIAVCTAFQRMGVGRRLLHCAENMAIHYGLGSISLEARTADNGLISWYENAGYAGGKILKDYYADGEHAIKMSKELSHPAAPDGLARIVVVDRLDYWKYNVPTVEVVSARDYISEPRFQTKRNLRVHNMCGSFRYQRTGYYVSLLAAARDHVVFPSVTTIRDFHSLAVIRTITSDLDDFLQQALKQTTSCSLVLDICFGHTLDRKYELLGQRLCKLFESPLIRVKLARLDRWVIQRVTPLTLKDLNQLDDEHSKKVEAFAVQYFARKKINRSRLKNYRYDLAILVDPKEAHPPSNPAALRLFEKTAATLGFDTELVTRDDLNRLNEFDALFIRETTRVDNHTYQFSRRAYAEGLAVIDDPWSILHCANKIYLDERMKKRRIPVPRTTVLYRPAFERKPPDGIGFPLILKQPDSSFSHGVRKVFTPQELKHALEQLFKQSDLIIAQQYIPSDYDWRIGVLDEVPLYACKYFMARDHWQIYNWGADHHDDQSGGVEAVPLDQVPAAVLQTALRAAALIGDGLYGVDLKEVAGKVYMIEINDNPSIDHGVEDLLLGDALYETIMRSILNRIELARNMARFVSIAPRKQPPLPLNNHNVHLPRTIDTSAASSRPNTTHSSTASSESAPVVRASRK